jgi:hypothetical protein
VGYAVYDSLGNVVSPRTTAGVYQVITGSGLYAAPVTYPDGFNGQIVWDCPPVTGSQGTVLSQSYAAEEQNYLANNPKADDTWQMVSSVTGSVQGLYDVAFGRWRIDPVANTMTFYRSDNVTVVATFNLLDSAGAPAFDSVFERQLAGSVIP